MKTTSEAPLENCTSPHAIIIKAYHISRTITMSEIGDAAEQILVTIQEIFLYFIPEEKSQY